MIVAMKKARIIMRLKEAPGALKDLRSLGLMHVEHNAAPQSNGLAMLQEDAILLNTCLEILDKLEATEKGRAQAKEVPCDWRPAAQHILELWKRYDQLESFGYTLSGLISAWEPWGDFDPRQIQRLREKGIFVRLYELPQGQLNKFPENVALKQIFTSAGVGRYAAFSRTDFSCPFKEVLLPEQGLCAMRARLAEDKKIMEAIKQEIDAAVSFRPSLLAQKEKFRKEIEFQQALAGMAKSGALTYITGYVPVDRVQRLTAEAKSKKWGLVVGQPQEEDNVPTLLRNPAWISIVNPVFKFLEILPGYRELDISLPFLIFFSIFFGMLIGDAGYGLVYALLTFLLQRKAKRRNVDTAVFFLFYTLSLCAIIWGLLTGTFFGQEWFLKAGYKPLLPGLNEEKSIQRFCFFLGAVHLTLAHSWRAILKFPSLSFLSDLGWGCILWAAFFVARLLILGDAFPFFGKWLLIAGITLVIFFTSPRRNMLKAAAEGLATLALGLMNNFTDVVSYIRLFAVGLAGVAISDASNSMAGLVGGGGILALAGSVIILLIGHSLAIVLGPVSVLVHGVRLNVLEFSGHANISWSGISYNPLKE